jgi:hypothetical protein
MRFVTTNLSCPQITLRNALGLGQEIRREDLRRWFPDDTTYNSAMDSFPISLDKQVKTEIWKSLTLSTKFCFGMISILNSDCRWVFIESSGLKIIGLNAAQFYLNKLHDKTVVVVYSNEFDLVGSFGESIVAIANEDAILGMGTPEWFQMFIRQTKSMVINNNAKKHVNHLLIEEDDDE